MWLLKILWTWESGHLTSMWRGHCLSTRIIKVCTWEPTVKGTKTSCCLHHRPSPFGVPVQDSVVSRPKYSSFCPSSTFCPQSGIQGKGKRESVLISYISGFEAGIWEKEVCLGRFLSQAHLLVNHGAINVCGIHSSSCRGKVVNGWARWAWYGNRRQKSSQHSLQLGCVKTHQETHNFVSRLPTKNT